MSRFIKNPEMYLQDLRNRTSVKLNGVPFQDLLVIINRCDIEAFRDICTLKFNGGIIENSLNRRVLSMLPDKFWGLVNRYCIFNKHSLSSLNKLYTLFSRDITERDVMELLSKCIWLYVKYNGDFINIEPSVFKLLDAVEIPMFVNVKNQYRYNCNFYTDISEKETSFCYYIVNGFNVSAIYSLLENNGLFNPIYSVLSRRY